MNIVHLADIHIWLIIIPQMDIVGNDVSATGEEQDSRIQEGAIVKIHSLQSVAAQQHNGAHAELGKFNPDTGRWQAKLRRGKTLSGVEIGVKPANLLFVRAPANAWRLDDARWTFSDCNSLLNKLQELSAARDWKGLVALEDQAIQIARLETGLTPANAGAIYYNLALAHENLRNFESAVKFHEQDLALAKRVGDSEWEAQAVRNISNARVPCTSHVRTTEDYERMQQEKGIEKFSTDDLIEFAQGLQKKGLHKRVFETLDAYLKIVETHRIAAAAAWERTTGRFPGSDRTQEGAAYGILIFSYLAMGHFHKAINCCEKRLLIAREYGNRQGESVALCSLGACYSELGQYKKAFEYLDQDLGIARELGDLEGEAKTLGNMGNVLYSQGNEFHRETSDLYLACQRCAEMAGDQATALRANIKRGQALCTPDTWSECSVLLSDGIILAQKLDDKKEMRFACGLLGHMYLEYHCLETGGAIWPTENTPTVISALHLAREWSVVALELNSQLHGHHLHLDLDLHLDLARQDYLLGEVDDAIEGLKLYLTVCRRSGRSRCEFCSQVRGEDAPMETCSECGVARYCSREHQKLSWNCHKKSNRLHTFSHKVMCPLWKRWRSVEKGKETAEECRQYFLDFLAFLNTLTDDGKKRADLERPFRSMQEEAGVYVCGTKECLGQDIPVSVGGESKSIPRMMIPNVANLPAPLLPGVGERVKVTGLIQKSEYNGRSATVAKLLDGGRICVVLDEGGVAVKTGKELSVNHENVETLLLENLQKLVVETSILEHQLQKTTQSTPPEQPSPSTAPAAGASPKHRSPKKGKNVTPDESSERTVEAKFYVDGTWNKAILGAQLGPDRQQVKFVGCEEHGWQDTAAKDIRFPVVKICKAKTSKVAAAGALFLTSFWDCFGAG